MAVLFSGDLEEFFFAVSSVESEVAKYSGAFHSSEFFVPVEFFAGSVFGDEAGSDIN